MLCYSKVVLTYVLKRHISSNVARDPDLDVDYTQEEFWTLLIQGEATNVLRERGDLRTHNSQTDSPTIPHERLAIGVAGQVLKQTILDSNIRYR